MQEELNNLWQKVILKLKVWILMKLLLPWLDSRMSLDLPRGMR
jgi:hypothetical protein